MSHRWLPNITFDRTSGSQVPSATRIAFTPKVNP